MAHHIQEKLLAQQGATTSAASIYSPPASTETETTTTVVKTIVVCNYSTSAATFSIYLDSDGTTYDTTSVLYAAVTIAANTTVQIDTFWAMDDPAGNLAIKASVNSAINVTVFGAEIS